MYYLPNQPVPKQPWNKGKLIGQKPPLKLNEIWGIRIRLQLARKFRELALFNLAIDSKLRACDLASLRVQNVLNGGSVTTRTIIMQRKTQQSVQFELTLQTRLSIETWINNAGLKTHDYLFPSRLSSFDHLSTRQYARLVSKWVSSVGLDPSTYGTHSLRRTKASLIYKRTHNLRAIQLLLGHTKLESTVKYLGIEVDDALEMAEQTEV